jgi:hypothetical protein
MALSASERELAGIFLVHGFVLALIGIACGLSPLDGAELRRGDRQLYCGLARDDAGSSGRRALGMSRAVHKNFQKSELRFTCLDGIGWRQGADGAWPDSGCRCETV